MVMLFLVLQAIPIYNNNHTKRPRNIEDHSSVCSRQTVNYLRGTDCKPVAAKKRKMKAIE